MYRPPPKSTRPDTLFPNTHVFRSARMRFALVVAAQIDDRFDSQRVDGRQIVVVSLDMMRRAPQDSVAQPSAAFDIIAAIVAEIMDARQGPDAIGTHGHSPVNTGARFWIGSASGREWVWRYVECPVEAGS